MAYIQGFPVAVPKTNKQAYVASARAAAPIFQEYGAIRVVETWSEIIPDGEITDFKRAVLATTDEAVVFSWIEWPDKETCDAGAKRMETDPRWKQMPDMPFDGKRMIWGGFDLVFSTDG